MKIHWQNWVICKCAKRIVVIIDLRYDVFERLHSLKRTSCIKQAYLTTEQLCRNHWLWLVVLLSQIWHQAIWPDQDAGWLLCSVSDQVHARSGQPNIFSSTVASSSEMNSYSWDFPNIFEQSISLFFLIFLMHCHFFLFMYQCCRPFSIW